jgi:hypothetical protein
VDLEAIRTYQGERDRPDIRRDGVWIQKRPATHLLYAGGARAGEPEVAGGEESLMAALIPLDVEPAVLAIDGVGNGVHRGYWLLAIGYWLLAIGYWLLAMP